MSGAAATSLSDAVAAERNRLAEEQEHASVTWEQADAALAQVLRLQAKARKDAKSATLREERENTSVAAIYSRGGENEESAIAVRSNKPLYTGQLDEEYIQRNKDRAERNALTREKAQETRAQHMQHRAAEASDKMKDHRKKLLRVKIADIMIEIQKRSSLHQQQEKARKLQERRGRSGTSPLVGDALPLALGLVGIAGDGNEGLSPRRTAVMNSLSMEEFTLIRKDPWFFFGTSHAAAASNDNSQVLKSSPSVLSLTSSAAVDPADSEKLVDFFTPSREDKDIPIQDYVGKLWAELRRFSKASQSRRPQQTQTASGGGSLGWRSRSSTDVTQRGHDEVGVLQTSASASTFTNLEMMPCLGRRPAVRDDALSPTLAKVRDVHKHRAQVDAKFAEDRLEGMNQRLALNAFKAQEQQREIQLQAFQQKELHKVRMVEARERKKLFEEEAQARADMAEKHKLERLALAALQAEEVVEEKRQKATDVLENWSRGVERSDRCFREKEIKQIRAAETEWSTYMEKLWRVGLSRHNRLESQAKKNDALKSQIQTSLVAQLDERQKQDSAALAEALDAKIEAAARRRQMGHLGIRYNFVEKAFGPQAVGFDAKHHTVSVDRRGRLWQQSSKAWQDQQTKFSQLTAGSPSNSRSNQGSPSNAASVRA